MTKAVSSSIFKYFSLVSLIFAISSCATNQQKEPTIDKRNTQVSTDTPLKNSLGKEVKVGWVSGQGFEPSVYARLVEKESRWGVTEVSITRIYPTEDSTEEILILDKTGTSILPGFALKEKDGSIQYGYNCSVLFAEKQKYDPCGYTQFTKVDVAGTAITNTLGVLLSYGLISGAEKELNANSISRIANDANAAAIMDLFRIEIAKESVIQSKLKGSVALFRGNLDRKWVVGKTNVSKKFLESLTPRPTFEIETDPSVRIFPSLKSSLIADKEWFSLESLSSEIERTRMRQREFEESFRFKVSCPSEPSGAFAYSCAKRNLKLNEIITNFTVNVTIDKKHPDYLAVVASEKRQKSASRSQSNSSKTGVKPTNSNSAIGFASASGSEIRPSSSNSYDDNILLCNNIANDYPRWERCVKQSKALYRESLQRGWGIQQGDEIYNSQFPF